MPQTPLENLVAKSLQARLAKQSLLLSISETNDLCEILEKYISAISGRGRKKKFASDAERWAHHNELRRKSKTPLRDAKAHKRAGARQQKP